MVVCRSTGRRRRRFEICIKKAVGGHDSEKRACGCGKAFIEILMYLYSSVFYVYLTAIARTVRAICGLGILGFGVSVFSPNGTKAMIWHGLLVLDRGSSSSVGGI